MLYPIYRSTQHRHGPIPRMSRLAERGDTIDAADEQHALLVYLRIPQAIRPRLASIFGPDSVELAGNVLAAGFPLPHLFLDRTFDLHPVIGVVRIDEQNRQSRIFADPFILTAMGGGVDEHLVALVVEPHRRQVDPPVRADQT